MSGGVDSVALLDSLITGRSIGVFNPKEFFSRGEVIVAHLDHGIREDSPEDEKLVRHLAERYGCEYRSRRVELRQNPSENNARQHRYDFLNEVCKEFDAQLIVAHHMNDCAETIAINLVRGTGWRGVAAMNSENIKRPLLGVTKKEIIAYALERKLSWHEDSTNDSDVYLRNTIRRRLTDENLVRQLATLRERQISVAAEIDEEIQQFITGDSYSRYFFTNCGDSVAVEVLRAILLDKKGDGLTIPARKRVLHAIKTARHGSRLVVSKWVAITFTQTHFVVE